MSEPKKNVVIAEDNEITLMSLSSMFRRGGYEVHSAASVSEAKNFVKKLDQLFAIVCDFEFETGNGIDILLEVHKKFPEAKMSIFTAHEDLEMRPDVSDLLFRNNLRGKIKFLYKPIERGAFADWISS